MRCNLAVVAAIQSITFVVFCVLFCRELREDYTLGKCFAFIISATGAIVTLIILLIVLSK